VPPVVAAEKGVGELAVREVPDEETNEASPALVKREASPSMAPCECQQVGFGGQQGESIESGERGWGRTASSGMGECATSDSAAGR
jgi:hypothetical protein